VVCSDVAATREEWALARAITGRSGRGGILAQHLSTNCDVSRPQAKGLTPSWRPPEGRDALPSGRTLEPFAQPRRQLLPPLVDAPRSVEHSVRLRAPPLTRPTTSPWRQQLDRMAHCRMGSSLNDTGSVGPARLLCFEFERQGGSSLMTIPLCLSAREHEGTRLDQRPFFGNSVF
jgi:hypothetical protein